MDILDAAKIYAELTSIDYPCIAVQVEGGEIKDITNDKLIPVKDIMYQKAPKDGIYYATEATCGGGTKSGCSVGNPQKECMDSCYSPQKCAVYSIDGIDDNTKVYTNIGQLRKLYERWYGLGSLGEPL